MTHPSALVLFSGGQDSTTCLAHALTRYQRVETIGFDYGQRHHVELQQRQVVLRALRARFPAWRQRLGEDHMIDMAVLALLGTITVFQRIREVYVSMRANGDAGVSKQ